MKRVMVGRLVNLKEQGDKKTNRTEISPFVSLKLVVSIWNKREQVGASEV